MNATELTTYCNDLRPILRAIHLFIEILKWSIPILIIVLGSFDMLKAVASGDEKVTSEARSTLIKRIVYGVIVFLVPFLVNLILEIVDDAFKDNSGLTSSTAWISCWTSVVSGTTIEDNTNEPAKLYICFNENYPVNSERPVNSCSDCKDYEECIEDR